MAREPQRWAPASELARVLTSRKDDWSQEQMEDAGRLLVYATNGRRKSSVRSAGSRNLRTGTLESRGRGKDLKIRSGSFDNWLGEDVAVRPDWGFDFDLAPDSDAGSAEQIRGQGRGSGAPSLPTRPGPPATPPIRASLSVAPSRASSESASKATRSPCGRSCSASTRPWPEVGQEFVVEDPLKPVTRSDLDRTQQRLEQALEFLESYYGPVALPELRQESLAEVRDCIVYFAGRGQ